MYSFTLVFFFFNFIILYSAVLGHGSLSTLLVLTPPDTDVPGPAGVSPLPTHLLLARGDVTPSDRNEMPRAPRMEQY